LFRSNICLILVALLCILTRACQNIACQSCRMVSVRKRMLNLS
jgi:hypothetical protein